MTIYEILKTCFALLAICLSIVSLVISHKAAQRQSRFSFFAEYTRRYQEITLNLLKNDENMSVYYKLYFDLCCEEHYLNDKRECNNPKYIIVK